jgi:basic membrane lipoprotein Med (substrate-binding protein (PBP1-ABC) superfamily)
MTKPKFIFASLFANALLSIFLATQWAEAAEPVSKLSSKSNSPLKVGLLCVGPITDWGFNYAHNQGRLYLEKNSNGGIQTTIAEKIPESAEAERVLEKLIASGHRLIFTTSYGYLEPALRVAKRHPAVTFMQINRFQTAKNLGTYFSQQYQPMYLAGMVAGRMTKSNKLGFVAAHPVPPLLQAINSFTMGARSVNAKAETRVIFINNWSDAPLEVEAVKSLAEAGCDVVAHAQDNQNTILSACESLGIYSVGFYTDAHNLAPKGWLTGACLDWGPFYAKIANLVANNKWQPCVYAGGMESSEGYVKLSSFGKAVPAKVRAEVMAQKELLEKGKFVIFSGPLKDRDGKERIAQGQTLDIKQLSEMNWFVSGVKGTSPKAH